jgi:outer membrane protein OmpA-like peptidoglycan-associated protein
MRRSNTRIRITLALVMPIILASATPAAAARADAALEALRERVLTEARQALVEAERARTKKWAPKTTAHARSLLAEADAALVADRARTGDAERLAAAAAAEARHAIVLSGRLRASEAAGATGEDLLLEREGDLARMAQAAGADVSLAGGPEPAAEALAAAIGALHERADQATRELLERNRQLASQDEEIRELEGKLQATTASARDLSTALQARERVERQFADLAALFAPEEATVLSEGDHVIVRLRALAFSGAGSARLAPSSAPLLGKLAQAVNVFPDALLSVEGHSDGSGDPAANQRLSQARAEAVRKFLTTSSGVAPGRVTAAGFGDSRPIASPASPEGRRANRRVEVVIAPPKESRP